jgi:predicted RNA binding protein YcfA (HicA-like mRNA interferase family)
MPKLPSLKSKQVIRALQQAGFVFVRQRGSHQMYIKGNNAVTIPYHNKDLKKGTLKHIIKQAGFEVEEFLKLL